MNHVTLGWEYCEGIKKLHVKENPLTKEKETWKKKHNDGRKNRIYKYMNMKIMRWSQNKNLSTKGSTRITKGS
jgi:predicted RNA-binding protein with RPS1 domain